MTLYIFLLLFLCLELKSIVGFIGRRSSTNEEDSEINENNPSDDADTSIDPSTLRMEEGNAARTNERQKNLITIVERIRGLTVHKLRQDGTIQEYKLYCELFYAVIVGKQKWKMNYSHIGIKTLTTVADEALIALLLENNIEEWLILANEGTIDAMERKTLYTHGGRGSGTTKKGWSLEGRLRYNTLHAELKEVRNDSDANVTDESLKRLWSYTNTVTSQRRAVQDNESTQLSECLEQEFEPVFDFDD